MRSGNFEWIWFIVIAVVWLLQVLGKRRSAGEGDKPSAVPKPKRSPQVRSQPVGQAKPPPEIPDRWLAAADQVRRFLDQIQGRVEPPAPAPAALPAVRQTVSAPPPPEPPPPPLPSPIAEPKTTPASVWAEALRDKQNLRRIIICAEIIGPPKGE